MTTHAPHPRIEAVIEETLAILNEEVRAGRITSDAAVEKVQHLINTVRKYATSSMPERRQSDREAAPSSATVDVVNFVNLPIQAPTQELSVDVRPQLLFVCLSTGIVNLQHIVWLDVAGKRLYLAGNIMAGLNDADVTALKYYLKLYALTN